MLLARFVSYIVQGTQFFLSAVVVILPDELCLVGLVFPLLRKLF